MRINKNSKKKTNQKESSGITLITLIITIIVLLILAAISLTMISGNNGIINKTINAKDNAEIAEEKEALGAAVAKSMGKNKYGNLLKNELEQQLNFDLGTGVTEVTSPEKNIINVKFTKTGRDYQVDADGNVYETEPKKMELELSDIATESRAALIIVSIKGANYTKPTYEKEYNWLKSISEDELKEVFAQTQYGIGETWASHFSGALFSNVRELYEYNNMTSYTDEYDMIIKKNTTKIEILETLYNKAYGIEIPSEVTVSCNGNSDTINFTSKTQAELPVTTNGTYTVTATNKGGSIATKSITVDKCKTEIYSDIQTSNYLLKKDGYEVMIPAGFAYGVSENVGTVTKGLVITDSIDENTHYSNGNEFVWIPIDKEELTVGKTDKLMATKKSGSDNYRGVLYSFSGTNSNAYSENFYNGTFYAQEPGFDTPFSAYVGEWNRITEFETMIENTKRYGGFYIGRYEIGESSFSKLAIKPTNEVDSNMYNFVTSYTNEYNSVKSGAIWCCQYHAVLNFGLTNSSDCNKVTGKTNGNHTASSVRTGCYVGNDVINNIFDLEGNCGEDTLLADGQVGGINWTVSYHNNYGGEGLATSGISTRTILYVK